MTGDRARVRGVCVLLAASVAGAACLLPSPAGAWGNGETHQRLTEAALVRLLRDEAFDKFLRQVYELENGFGTTFVMELDATLDETPTLWIDYYDRIEDEFASGGRLEKDQSRIGAHTPPDSVLLNQGGQVSASVEQLLRTGSWAEDNPNPRARHHFHDTEVLHPPPAGNRGMDNQFRRDSGVYGSPFVNRVGSWILRGGRFSDLLTGNEFDLRGFSALDRALNRPPDGSTLPTFQPPGTNYFDLGDTERYLYRAMAGASETERELAMGLHFLALGHVIHLLEDMSSPAHVRNDFVFDHLRPAIHEAAGYRLGDPNVGQQLETFAEAGAPVGLPVRLGREPDVDFFASRPRRFLESLNLPSGSVDPGQFVANLTPLSASGFDAADFWQGGIVGQAPARPGIAEFVHDHFFSRDTVPGLNPDNYTRPDVGTTCDLLPLRGHGGEEVRDILDPGAPAEGLYLLSPLVPHLARCNLHFDDVVAAQGSMSIEDFYVFSVIDDAVRWDYMELLFPTTIDFVEEFLRFYLTPRIEVVPLAEGGFTLRNLATLPFEFDGEAVEIAYDDIDGVRHTVPVDCGTDTYTLQPSDTPGEPGPPGPFTCAMPDSIPMPAKNRGDFFVMVRGRLGARGIAEEADLLDIFGNGQFLNDFVLGFDHVRSRVAFDRLTGTSADDTGELDIYLVDIDPTEELVPGADRFEPAKLTGRIRDALGRPDLDFVTPVAEPEGVRLAIRSDRDAPADGSGFTDVRAPLDLFLFDPWLETDDPAILAPIPHSRISGIVDRAKLRTAWSADAMTLFYLDNLEDPDEEAPPTPLQEMFLSLNRYDVASGSSELFEWDAGAVASEDEETPDADLPVGTERIRCGGIEQVAALTDTRIAVVSRCKKEEIVEDAQGNKVRELKEKGANLFLADVVPSADFPGQLDVVFTHRVTPDQGVVDCGTECWMFDGFVYGAAFSPDGTQIAFLTGDDETNLDFGLALHVAGVSSGGVTELASFPDARIVNPTWSPQGRWLAVGVDEAGGAGPREIQVVEPDAASPELRPATDDAEPARILSWYKPLLLLP